MINQEEKTLNPWDQAFAVHKLDVIRGFDDVYGTHTKEGMRDYVQSAWKDLLGYDSFDLLDEHVRIIATELVYMDVLDLDAARKQMNDRANDFADDETKAEVDERFAKFKADLVSWVFGKFGS